VAPSVFILIAVTRVYLAFGSVPAVAGILYGVKLAVTAIVVFAAYRIGSRALKNGVLRAMVAATARPAGVSVRPSLTTTRRPVLGALLLEQARCPQRGRSRPVARRDGAARGAGRLERRAAGSRVPGRRSSCGTGNAPAVRITSGAGWNTDAERRRTERLLAEDLAWLGHA